MPFNTALSGIRAANEDLRITGNNIANASTTGFKESRAEFGDVYSTSVLGSGLNQVGSGVRVQDVAQQFSQGNIAFTENVLDLAISGTGFFVTSLDGDQSYTRAGTFGLDQEGYIVNNTDYRLQGYVADDAGNITGLLQDIQIETNNLQPVTTTLVESELNLDAQESVLQSTGTRYLSSVAAAAQNNNGYASQTFTVTNSDGGTATYTSTANDDSLTIASALNNLPGITATATSTATITGWTGANLSINGTTLTATTLAAAETEINSSLPGFTATLNGAGTELTVVSSIGDLEFDLSGGTGAETLSVVGGSGGAQTITDGDANTVIVGGAIQIDIDEGYTLDVSASPIFAAVTPTTYINNAFDPTDPSTYNHSTSLTIYDSLGVAHVMQQFFIKQPYDPADATTFPNHWQMAVMIDGEDVGDATNPSQGAVALYDLYFTENGDIDETLTGDIIISGWTPQVGSSTVNSSVALGPLSYADSGGNLTIDNTVSSNFEIDMTNTTQVGAEFEVRSVEQNGLTIGRLAGISIDDTGVIFARYTNGENRILAQVALADFPNEQGLQQLGDTSWAETYESGEPVIGAPGTASRGLVQSGALEESNVELSDQLVNLIIAQRNFQASAKTIETADQTTQTIINLR